MGKFFTEIPDFLIPWIQQQKIFWVATAPLSSSGHINVSPKGFEGTFHIENEVTVWYEDLTGSGIETISHLRENGRMTVMFYAFEGPPQIVRLFGIGSVHEFGTPEYDALIPSDKRQPGSRAVIRLDIHKVGTSCGYSIPFFTYKSPRMRLHAAMASKEAKDIEAETTTTMVTSPAKSYTSSTPDQATKPPPTGLKAYWKSKNHASIDGLAGLNTAFESSATFDSSVASRNWGKDDESISTSAGPKSGGKMTALQWLGLDMRLFVAFVFGMAVSSFWGKFNAVRI